MPRQPARQYCRIITIERYGKDEEGSGGKVPGLAWRDSTNT